MAQTLARRRTTQQDEHSDDTPAAPVAAASRIGTRQATAPAGAIRPARAPSWAEIEAAESRGEGWIQKE